MKESRTLVLLIAALLMALAVGPTDSRSGWLPTAAAQEANEVPKKYIGKWRGLFARGEASSRQQTGMAVVAKDFGHMVDKFEFEVAKDGKVKGSGRATYYFNVSASANLIVTTVSPSAYLEGGAQTLDFDIEGQVTPEGKMKLAASPKGDLTLINAGTKQPMGAWNVFGPLEGQVSEEGCKTVVHASRMIQEIGMKIEWKAERKCYVACKVNRTEESQFKTPRTAEISLVVLHATGGPDPEPTCDPARHFKGGKNAAGSISWLTTHPLNTRKASADFIIDRDGTVVRLVPDGYAANHVSPSVNNKSIGIELVNNGENDTDPYEDPQLNALIGLLVELLRCNGLGVDALKGHYEFSRAMVNCTGGTRYREDRRGNRTAYEATTYKGPRRIDPGPHFPWDRVRSEVAQRLEEADQE